MPKRTQMILLFSFVLNIHAVLYLDVLGSYGTVLHSTRSGLIKSIYNSDLIHLAKYGFFRHGDKLESHIYAYSFLYLAD